MEPEGGPGEHGFYRNGRRSLSVSTGQRALIRAAWWLSGEIGRGETERRGRAICRRGVASNQEGNHRELRGEEMRCLGLGHRENFGWRWVMTGGSHCQ
jgi:hypothetical protein